MNIATIFKQLAILIGGVSVRNKFQSILRIISYYFHTLLLRNILLLKHQLFIIKINVPNAFFYMTKVNGKLILNMYINVIFPHNLNNKSALIYHLFHKDLHSMNLSFFHLFRANQQLDPCINYNPGYVLVASIVKC